jgi:hypothetical protein
VLVFLIRHWQTIAAFTAGALVGALLLYAWANAFAIPDARQEGMELERAAVNARAMRIIQERSRLNEEIGRMSLSELCTELGGVWMPEDGECR